MHHQKPPSICLLSHALIYISFCAANWGLHVHYLTPAQVRPFHVHRKHSHGDNDAFLKWSDGATAVEWLRLLGLFSTDADGNGCFAHEKKKKTLPSTVSHLLFPSVSLFLPPPPLSWLSFAFSYFVLTCSHNWTWQCFRDGLAAVNGKLPVSPVFSMYVCVCVYLQAG